MNIGEKIIKLRKKKNISQEKLSEITSPNLNQTKKMSEIFGVSLDELTGNKRKLFKTINK